MSARHEAGHATYPGLVRDIVGEVKGPLTYGGFVVAEKAIYDTETDTTRVTFGHLRGDEAVFVDELGIRRLVDAATAPVVFSSPSAAATVKAGGVATTNDIGDDTTQPDKTQR